MAGEGSPGARTNHGVGLVLAGGGARGAYEMGALAVLLPELDKRGEYPGVIVGTSVGALNASFVAGTAQLLVEEGVKLGLAIWDEIRFEQVLRRVRSPGTLWRAASYVGQFFRLPGARLYALLDPGPLRRTVHKHVPVDQIKANVDSGKLRAAAVVATSAATSRSVVFHRGGEPPQHDDKRAIDYVNGKLHAEHVRASAAIPGLFPAVKIASPEEARGWYFDGGTRLNTPIKPAIQLGAKKIVVVALNAIERRPARLAGDKRPDALQGAYQLLDGLLAAPLAHDVATLSSVNQMLKGAGGKLDDKEELHYVFVAPTEPYAIGKLAWEVFNQHYAHLAKALCNELAFLGRAVAAGSDPIHGELLSYLFFAPEFAQALIAQGERDARGWLKEHPQLWETGPLHVGRV